MFRDLDQGVLVEARAMLPLAEEARWRARNGILLPEKITLLQLLLLLLDHPISSDD
jgi:hypothetical protein